MASRGLKRWAADQGTVQNYTEAKGSCPEQVKILVQVQPLSQFSGRTEE